MKKYIVLIVLVLIAQRTSSVAQEIRLDSLWAKQGGVFAMSFSPDSKTLVIGEDGDEGQIRIFDAQTGKELDSISHSDFVDMQFTPNGKQLMVIDRTTIKFYSSTSYKIERTIPYDQGGLITFSSNGLVVALTGGTSITIFDIEKGEVLAKLTRPYQYSTSPNKTEYYWNGKVCFSADGKYIIGKYENSLVRWDWQNAPTKPEVLIGSFGNRAIIGFSPDKKYLVQQSNYLWDIQQGKQVVVEGLKNFSDETAYGFATTASGSRLVVTGEDHTPKFINVETKKLFSTVPIKYFTLMMAISPDSNYLVRQVGSDAVLMQRLLFGTNQVEAINDSTVPTLSILPYPAQSLLEVNLSNSTPIVSAVLSISDTIGSLVKTLYVGYLESGNHAFQLETSNFSSGYYTLLLKYNNSQMSTPIIIIK